MIFYQPSFFTIMNYECDSYLDTMLNTCIDSGIKSFTSMGEYYAIVVFNNGINYNFWNSGRYHAWLARGRIGGYTYNDARPSKRVMRKFRRLLAGKLETGIDVLKSEIMSIDGDKK